MRVNVLPAYMYVHPMKTAPLETRRGTKTLKLELQIIVVAED